MPIYAKTSKISPAVLWSTSLHFEVPSAKRCKAAVRGLAGGDEEPRAHIRKTGRQPLSCRVRMETEEFKLQILVTSEE